ncbi:hypothetical protein D3C76_1846190 [compost metagenome]
MLVPLSDIVPQDHSASSLYKQLTAALQDLDGKEGMRLWTSKEWADGSEHSGN